MTEIFEVPKEIQLKTEKIDLWKPEEIEDVPEQVKGLFKQYNTALKLIAKKLSRQYDLDEHDFVIRLWLSKKEPSFKVEIHRGVLVRVYFGVLPTDNDFDSVIRRTLKQVRKIRGSKSLERVDRLTETRDWIASRFPVIKETDKFGYNDLEISYVRKVIVKHKETGLIVEREASEKNATIRQLIAMAKIELAENVDLVKQLQEKKNVEARTENSVPLPAQ